MAPVFDHGKMLKEYMIKIFENIQEKWKNFSG
ncbi:MAG: hypothetical protein CM15mV89_1000 [Caudoviricetes sp.]|nr:MAG: hypothetical protein CM15mV89_1000 [Caudoviricetes sp.]